MSLMMHARNRAPWRGTDGLVAHRMRSKTTQEMEQLRNEAILSGKNPLGVGTEVFVEWCEWEIQRKEREGPPHGD